MNLRFYSFSTHWLPLMGPRRGAATSMSAIGSDFNRSTQPSVTMLQLHEASFDRFHATWGHDRRGRARQVVDLRHRYFCFCSLRIPAGLGTAGAPSYVLSWSHKLVRVLEYVASPGINQWLHIT